MGCKSAIIDRRSREDLSTVRRLLQGRCGQLALAISAAGVLLLSSAEANNAAACRGAGVTSRGADGTTLTKWSDGAYVKKYTDGSEAWAYPSGSPPVPGASPGHNPY